MKEESVKKGLSTASTEASQQEVYRDVYYDSFFGMGELEKEFRADGWYRGCVRDYVTRKGELISTRPRNYAFNCITDCYMAAPSRAYAFLKDVVTVMHSPAGCAFILELLNQAYGARVMCTMLDKSDAVLGGEQKLRETIYKAIERYHPGFIGVVATCTPEIIGEDIEGISAAIEAETGVFVQPFHAAGFRHKVWNIGTDEAFNIIVDRFMEKTDRKNKGSVNLVNFAGIPETWKDMYELSCYLKSIGVKVNAYVPFFMTFKEMVEKVPMAELNVARCTGLGYQAMEFMEKRLGIPYLQLQKPMSYKYTERWIREIAKFFGLEERAEAFIKQEKGKYQARFDEVRRRLQGKRIAIGAGPGRFMGWMQLAAEMGMEVVYTYVAKHDPRLNDTLKEWIAETGQDPVLITGAALWEHEAVLDQIKVDLFVGLPEEQAVALRQGIPTIDFISVDKPGFIGFRGAVMGAELMASVIEHPLHKNYWPHLYRAYEPGAHPQWLATRPIPLGSLQKCKKIGKED